MAKVRLLAIIQLHKGHKTRARDARFSPPSKRQYVGISSYDYLAKGHKTPLLFFKPSLMSVKHLGYKTLWFDG